jgi:hypothetical protein
MVVVEEGVVHVEEEHARHHIGAYCLAPAADFYTRPS